MQQVKARGWTRFAADDRSLAWAKAARSEALRVVVAPAMQKAWLQCEGTWFVGVDALPTRPDGSIGTTMLAGPAIDALAPLPHLHPAQLSVVYPGYPRPRVGESVAAIGYRQRRDAAHVDGLLAEGSDKRRRITEPHSFILGLPLTQADVGASPLVIWEGSHRILREAFIQALAPFPRDQWDKVDVTEVYQKARRTCFDTCPRVPLNAAPGEALLLHRLVLHGVAPWQEGAVAPPEGRMIAYFRPQIEGGATAWLEDG